MLGDESSPEAESAETRAFSTPFHDVGRVLPESVEVVSIAPSSTVADAVDLMIRHKYSQLPVIENGELRGVFSLWGMAGQIAQRGDLRIHDLLVEDLMEQSILVTVDHSLHEVRSQIEEAEYVVVGSRAQVQAVITSADLLRYLYELVKPFVLLGEIELALRDILARTLTSGQLSDCIDRTLRQLYEGRGRVPTAVSEMSFEDYRSLVGNRENWPLFNSAFGKNRDFVIARLESIREIRNRNLSLSRRAQPRGSAKPDGLEGLDA